MRMKLMLFTPSGVGTSCLAESLARSMLFVIIGFAPCRVVVSRDLADAPDGCSERPPRESLHARCGGRAAWCDASREIRGNPRRDLREAVRAGRWTECSFQALGGRAS